MNSIHWGIIGCGDVAEHKGGPALYTAPRSSLVAVMSRREERAADFARRHGAARHYTRLEDLLADEEIDAVYIATPPHVHAEQTLLAAQAGKHVLCEKPMAMSVAECKEMVRACRDNGVQLMIAYYRRFFPVIEKMKERIAGGAIGEPVRARAAVTGYYEPRADGERAWLTDPSVAGGGFLTDVGSHRIDLFTHFLGEVTAVAAFTGALTFSMEVDDTSTVLMQFDGGSHAELSANWNVKTPVDTFEIWGTEGILNATDLGKGILEITAGASTERFHLPAPAITHLGQVEHFVQSLIAGTPNALPGEAGMQTTRILEAAYASAREGTVVRMT